jgi:hypothetical protein
MDMMRYTAFVKYKRKTFFKKSHSDFLTLQAMLLVFLQDKFSHATGLIVDNNSGQTVNTYRKATCND